jgi:uncharacterized membrane protein YccC
MWQDFVLMACSVFFAIALIPALKAIEKPALKTSIMTGICLAIACGIDLTLALWFTAFFTAITSVMWFILALQAYRKDQRSRSCWIQS